MRDVGLNFDPSCATCCDPVEWCYKHNDPPVHDGRSSDSIMLLVWEEWAKKEGNDGAATLFRQAAGAMTERDAAARILAEISWIAEDYVGVDVAHDDPVYAVRIMAQIIDELASCRNDASRASAAVDRARSTTPAADLTPEKRNV